MKQNLSPIRTKRKINSLYIHIPFCHHLCHYCDFPKMLYDEKMAFSYVDSLLNELDTYQIDKVETIYVGGGTPSALNIELLNKLFTRLQPLLIDGGEFSVEINPENTNKEKLELLKKYGVNRLSIGLQSSHPNILKILNRKHSFEDVENIVDIARKLVFSSINIDLIYGAPSQSIEMLQDDISKVLSLNPEHIAIYSLTFHPGTVFFLKGFCEQNQDDSRSYYDLILKELRNHGYQRYEVSNFAKPGFKSRHNLTYWRNEPYYGVGLGASGFIEGVRYDNTRNMTAYLKGQYRCAEEKIDQLEDEKYFWMLNLRLEDGFDINEYVSRYGKKLLEEREKTLTDAFNNALMIKSKGRIAPTDEGLMVLDRILLKII